MKHLAVLLAAILTLTTVSPVAANSECDPGRPNDFPTIRYGGWHERATSGHYLNAVGASLEYLTPYAQPFAGGSTSVWIGIGDNDTSAYVQVGYRAYSTIIGTTQREIFFQYKTTGGTVYEKPPWSAPAIDSVHDFQITRQGNGSYNIYYDSGLAYTVTQGQVGWFLPDKTQIAMETQSWTHQYFGGTWDYEDVDLKRYAVDGGAYLDYGESAYSIEIPMHTDPANSAVWKYPNNEPYPAMDLFDWDCH